MSRLLVANLAGEAALAGGAALPEALLQRLSAVGTLMRAFAEPGDRLWTPRPVDPGCLAPAPGLPRPALISGVLPDAKQLLPWMAAPPLRAPWPLVTEACIRRVARRSFGFRLARNLGQALPGACAITSLAEFELAVSRLPGPWVLKPAWSAAGRGHLFGTGRLAATDPLRRRVAGLLAAQGWAQLEPWLSRELDVGWCGVVLARGEIVRGSSHTLRIDGRGRFRGVRLIRGDPRAPGLSTGEHERLESTARAVGCALADQGFMGPFGIDAMRTVEGVFHPLVELNARLGFGALTRALVGRVAGVGDGECVELRFGRSLPEPGAVPAPGPHEPGRGEQSGLAPGRAEPTPRHPTLIPLLRPDPTHRAGGSAAWLDIR